jgi:hypothetical protein
MITSMDLIDGTAEELPALYRSILALVEELERNDRRREAARIRARALTAYATAWDTRQRQRLEQLESRLRRSVAQGRPSTRFWRSRLP